MSGSPLPDPALPSGGRGRRSSAPAWMITLADLLSLLVAFLALLYAAMAPSPARWDQVVRPIATYLGAAPPAPAIAATPTVPTGAEDRLNYLSAMLGRLIASDPALGGSALLREGDRLRLVLPARPALAQWIAGEPQAGAGPGTSRAPAPLAGLARLLGALEARASLSVTVVAAEPRDPETARLWQRALADADALAAELSRLGAPKLLASEGRVAVIPAAGSGRQGVDTAGAGVVELSIAAPTSGPTGA